MNKEEAIQEAISQHKVAMVQYHVIQNASRTNYLVIHDGIRQSLIADQVISNDEVVYSTKNMFDYAIEFIGETPLSQVKILSQLLPNTKKVTAYFDDTNATIENVLINFSEDITDGSTIPHFVELVLPSGETFTFFDREEDELIMEKMEESLEKFSYN